MAVGIADGHVERDGLEERQHAHPADVPGEEIRHGAKRRAWSGRHRTGIGEPAERHDLGHGGVDTRRLIDAGFDYRYLNAGAVESFVRGLRLRRSTGRRPASYTYEHDVEQFFRHSPSVVQAGDD